jgi:nitroreductase
LHTSATFNRLLAAHANGVGTIAQTSLASFPHVVRKYFAVPEEFALLCGISFGYPDEADAVNRFRPGRADIAEFMVPPKSAELPEEEPLVEATAR